MIARKICGASRQTGPEPIHLPCYGHDRDAPSNARRQPTRRSSAGTRAHLGASEFLRRYETMPELRVVRIEAKGQSLHRRKRS
jgi:hypothetical protein